MVATDGLIQKTKLGGAWDVDYLRDAVARYGNENVYDMYLTICQELLEQFSSPVGYRVDKWTAYSNRKDHDGHVGDQPGDNVVHWAAVLER